MRKLMRQPGFTSDDAVSGCPLVIIVIASPKGQFGSLSPHITLRDASRWLFSRRWSSPVTVTQRIAFARAAAAPVTGLRVGRWANINEGMPIFNALIQC